MKHHEDDARETMERNLKKKKKKEKDMIHVVKAVKKKSAG